MVENEWKIINSHTLPGGVFPIIRHDARSRRTSWRSSTGSELWLALATKDWWLLMDQGGCWPKFLMTSWDHIFTSWLAFQILDPPRHVVLSLPIMTTTPGVVSLLLLSWMPTWRGRKKLVCIHARDKHKTNLTENTFQVSSNDNLEHQLRLEMQSK